MADIISNFPNDILCYILSFLPSQQVVATSVLSKRWNLLWRSVHSFDFDFGYHGRSIDTYEVDYYRFLFSMSSFLVWRDRNQPLHRFRLSCADIFNNFTSKSIKTAVSGFGRVQHIDLNLDSQMVMPSVVFTCKTLVVLRLAHITLSEISFVDLPSLKILHFDFVSVSKDLNFSQLLSGCPNLEDLEVKNMVCESKGTFVRLPKLVRASIDEHLLPLETVKNVEVLFIDWICPRNLDIDFPNLVQLQLIVRFREDWPGVLRVLKHCPKLQTLVICINKINPELFVASYKEEDVRPYQQSVPACISSHLKSCCLKGYSGSVDEFQFARYVMENAKYLRTMKICIFGGKINMIRELFSFIKRSDICTLSFGYG
ncbi:F-box/FBD/LRR-repeat protein At4g26340-like [Vigna unguiculata]|uniref:F-box/FBD/LRR-repeat protein At4g26340-like n=1 Tax=Vigna unguiculata TaxID=3917 RepID=UPI0010171967|nr:F-box/FBD/LRR-repeat protein At4g26340-like [Vigna unguiculata]